MMAYPLQRKVRENIECTVWILICCTEFKTDGLVCNDQNI